MSDTNKAWEDFDKTIDVEGLKTDVKEASENNQEFKEVPNDEYEVKIEKLELVASKAGDPMVSCWMRILEGDFKNSMIFMNQVITQGFQIHIANEFLRGLDSQIEVEFVNYKQYGSLLMDILEAVDGVLEFSLDYGKNKKGYNTFKILEVYEVE